ncbi:hypothetical protein DFH06DRAFT_1341682 [Mycena polygramma]|nr:hypothetical protein DFH06DRAFT_1341682 [Mycena polygramma]
MPLELSVPTFGTTTAASSFKPRPPNSACTGASCHFHSGFFQDLRDFPQPLDQPSIEGCPIIELPDSTQDFTHVLNALYNPLLFDQGGLPFPFIAAIIRLGRKYDFENLFRAALKRLSYENPTTFEGHHHLKLDDRMRYSPTQI